MASSQASAVSGPVTPVWSTTARILAVVQQQDPYRLCSGLLCGSGIGGRNAGILPNGQGRHGIQPQIVGQIGHGIVEGDAVAEIQRGRCLLQLRFHLPDAVEVGFRVGFIRRGMIRIGRAQTVPQVFHHRGIAGRADPIVFVHRGLLMLVGILPFMVMVAVQQVDPLGGIHGDKTGKLLQCALQEALRARPGQQQDIGSLQRCHIVRRHLIVVQAAGAGPHQAFQLDSLHLPRQVHGRDIHRIKGGHNAGLPRFFRPYRAGEQGDDHRHRHDQNHQERHSPDTFFAHGIDSFRGN